MKTRPFLAPPTSQHLKAGRVLLGPGESMGRHVTEGREGLSVVLRGSVTVKERTDVNLAAGMAHFIGKGVSHDVSNPSREEAEYLYIVAILK